MWTVVLEADQTTSPNVAPVASFTANCPQATCTVDASGSTDTAPGTVASYAWDFGDGTTGTGVTATHTYATSGAKTITLVVTDNQGLASRAGDPHRQPDRRDRPATPCPGTPGSCRTSRGTTPRVISNGEIWDIEVIPSLNRVFIAGSFTSTANSDRSRRRRSTRPTCVSYNLNTGLIDTSFRPDLQRRRGRGRGHA